VQNVFQCKGWQVRKRPVGFTPRIQGLASVTKAPNERLATDLCWVWARVQTPFLLRTDNGLIFTSRSYMALVKSYGLQQEFITP
jgi:putative transposase